MVVVGLKVELVQGEWRWMSFVFHPLGMNEGQEVLGPQREVLGFENGDELEVEIVGFLGVGRKVFRE